MRALSALICIDLQEGVRHLKLLLGRTAPGGRPALVMTVLAHVRSDSAASEHTCHRIRGFLLFMNC